MIIDGKKIIFLPSLSNTEELKAKHNKVPGLTVILIGDDPASQIYVRNKEKFAKEVGINSKLLRFENSITEQDLIKEIHKLNNDNSVHGILVQLPLPKHINKQKVIETITPSKDVDGFHPMNVYYDSSGNDAFVKPYSENTAKTIDEEISKMIELEYPNIVGKPMAQLLLNESCTVTIAHSRTKDLADVVRRADIVVAAVGRPEMVPGDWVKKDCVIIDVGINRVDNGNKKIVGDVDFENIKDKVKAITPVPGGVGPMTISCLLNNTLKAYKKINSI